MSSPDHLAGSSPIFQFPFHQRTKSFAICLPISGIQFEFKERDTEESPKGYPETSEGSAIRSGVMTQALPNRRAAAEAQPAAVIQRASEPRQALLDLGITISAVLGMRRTGWNSYSILSKEATEHIIN